MTSRGLAPDPSDDLAATAEGPPAHWFQGNSQAVADVAQLRLAHARTQLRAPTGAVELSAQSHGTVRSLRTPGQNKIYRTCAAAAAGHCCHPEATSMLTLIRAAITYMLLGERWDQCTDEQFVKHSLGHDQRARITMCPCPSKVARTRGDDKGRQKQAASRSARRPRERISGDLIRLVV